MTVAKTGFPAVLISLWLRLITIAAIALLFAVTPQFPEMIADWRFYQTTGEIVFGVAARVVFVALAGVALGTICTAAIAPFLLGYASSRQRIAEVAIRFAVGLAAFGDLSIVARMVMKPLAKLAGLQWFPVMILYSIAFALALCFRRPRNQIVTSLDGFLGEKATRRAAIATALATAGLVVSELTLAKVASAGAVPARAARRSGPNILLVTFDALSAEDMSLYGYRLPTTPRIDEFARKASVFTNFYSASTFTTPGVATLLTGRYPSEHGIYHLQGRLRGDNAAKTLPHLMRAAGYSTGASVSNPYAYFPAAGMGAAFDILPDPAYSAASFDLWRDTGFLHQRQPYGSRARELTDLEMLVDYLPYRLESYSPRLFAKAKSEFPPAANFAQAREVLDKLPDSFFMWVHVFAPHGPYLPGPSWLGRFLPTGEMRRASDQVRFPMSSNYSPAAQPLIDKARLRYDEFIGEADQAFGAFLSGLEGAGRLRNTAVIVAADHGESFEGGLYTHYSESQTRPEIHIPLIIRMPGQQQGRRVGMTVDQTALPPTLLEIAGLPRPGWMRGQSLLPWSNGGSSSDDKSNSEGLAFTQCLMADSVFRPLHAGTVGVIDGRSQYVLNLATNKGMLRSLAEANLRDLDRSAENPALAQALRQAIYARFPELPR